MTVYRAHLSVPGATVALDYTTCRKTRAALVDAAFYCRAALVDLMPREDFEADTAYSDGALLFGRSLLFLRAE